MSSIDDRVVKMTFDNAQFERNVATTLSTLGKLKSALNFEGSAKGLGELQAKASNFTMEAMASSIQSIADRFTIMGMTATRILEDIVGKAVNAGEQMAKALTIEPVVSGMQEYETQINAVQTILANTKDKLVKNEGLTEEHDQIERINAVLDDLNKYADMTIYNFTEMTRNIGTFTAAGVELDTAQKAIKGIANLAAVSGSDSNQASRAMYQLSQALAAGVVHLQDWNSVVNAGMGGEVFQNAIIDTARAKGVEIDEMMEEVGGSFRSLLNAQDYDDWLTADILLESLEKFTAGSEGFTQQQVEQQKELWKARGYSEEQIEDLVGQLNILTEAQEAETRAMWKARGYTDEQVDSIMALGKMSTEAATKVKTFSQLIDTTKEAMQSGWTQSWEYIIGDFEQAKQLWTEISDILNLYIGKSAEARNEMLKGWSQGRTDENGNLIDVEGTGREKVIAGIRNAFQGVFEIVIALNDAWDSSFLHKGLADDISLSSDKLVELSQQFMEFTQKFKNALVVDGKATPLLEEIKKIAESVFGSLRNVYDGFVNIGTVLGRGFTEGISSVVESFELLKSDGMIYEYLQTITSNFSEFAGILESEVFTNEAVSSFFSALAEAAKTLFEIKMDVALAAWDSFDRILREITDNYTTVDDFIINFSNGVNSFVQAIQNLIYTEDGVNRIDQLFDNVTNNIIEFIQGVKGLDFNGFDSWINGLKEFISSNPDVIFDTFRNALEGIANIGETIYGIFTPLIDAFFQTFVASDILTYVEKFSEMFRKFTEAIKIDPANMDNIQKFFKGVFDVLKVVVDVILDSAIGAFNGLGDALSNILPSQGDFAATLGDIGGSLSELAGKIREAISSGDGSSLIVQTLESLGKSAGEFISNITKGIELPNIFDKIKEWIHNIDFTNLSATWENFVSGFSKSKDSIKTADEGSGILEKLGNALRAVGDVISNFLDKVDINGTLAAIASLFTARNMAKLLSFFNDLTENLREIFTVTEEHGGIRGKLVSILTSLKDSLVGFQRSITASQILMIAASIAAIAFSVKKISEVNPDTVGAGLAALAGGIAEMMGAFAATNFISGKTGNASMSSIVMLLAIAHVLKQLADIVIEVSSIGNVDQAVRVLADMVLDLVAAFGVMSVALDNMDSKKGLISAGISLLLIGAALNIVSEAVTKLSNVNPERLTDSVSNLGFALAELVAALIILINFGTVESSKQLGFGEGSGSFSSSKPVNLIIAAASMILMGEALKVVSDAVTKLSALSPEAMAQGIIGVGFALGELVGALLLLTNFGDQSSSVKFGKESVASTSTMDLLGAAKAMQMMVEALNSVADVVAKFSALSLPQLTQGMGAVAVALGGLVGSLLLLTNFGDGHSKTNIGDGSITTSGTMDIIQAAFSMILVGAALNVVAKAVEKLAALNPDALSRSMSAMTVSLGELVGALLLLVNFGGTEGKAGGATDVIKSAISMILIGEALKVIADAVAKFGAINPDQVAQGLIAMAAALLEVIYATSLMPEAKVALQSALGLAAMGAALKVVGNAVNTFASIPVDTILPGLGAMAGAIMGIIMAIEMMPKASEAIPAAISIAVFGAALNIVSGAVQSMSAIPWEQMKVGLGGLAIVLTEMGVALWAFSKIGGAGTVSDEITGMSPALIQTAGAMLIMAAAIGVMAPALAVLSAIPLPGLGVALLAVAGGFIAFAGVAEIIQPTIPAIMSLSGAIAILSIGVLALVAAFTLMGSLLAGMGPSANQALLNILNAIIQLTPKFGEAIEAIGTAIQTAVPAIFETIRTVIVSLVTNVAQILVALIPQVVVIIGMIIQAIGLAVQMNGGTVFQIIRDCISGILQLIIELAPQFGQAAISVLTTILQVIRETAPDFGETAVTVINTVLQSLIEVLPKVGETVTAFITTAITTFNEVSPKVIEAVLKFLTNLIKSLAEYIPQMTDAGLKLLIGFLTAIGQNLPQVITAAVNVISSFCLGIAQNMEKLVDSAFKMVIGFIDGLATAIEENHDELFDAIGHLIQAIVDAVVDGISRVVDAGSKMVSEFINNFDGEQFIEDIKEAGANLVRGFISGIGSLGTELWNAACGIANDAIGAITKTTQEHSPSKVSFGQGANLTQGLINGMQSLTGQLSSTASSIASTAMEALGGIDTASISPSISPVLDTSAIQDGIDLSGVDLSGANLTDIDLSSIDLSNMDTSNIDLTSMMGDFDIQSAYGDLGTNIDTNFGDLTSSNQGLADSITGAIGDGTSTTSKDISGSTDKIVGSLSSLLETMKNLDVVLDTGKLVGELTPMIDKSLGNVSMLASRGVV